MTQNKKSEKKPIARVEFERLENLMVSGKIATLESFKEAISGLSEQGKYFDEKQKGRLLFSAIVNIKDAQQRQSVVKYLLEEQDADPNTNVVIPSKNINSFPLLAAANIGDDIVILQLLFEEASLFEKGQCKLLAEKRKSDSFNFLDILFTGNCDERQKLKCLSRALKWITTPGKYTEPQKYAFLNARVKNEPSGMTVLAALTESGKLEAVNLLCQYGADPNLTDQKKRLFPLVLAAESGYCLQDLCYLVNSSCQHAKDFALFAAIRKRERAAAAFLLKEGANPNILHKNIDGSYINCLHHCVKYTPIDIELIQLLIITFNADVNCKDGDGFTPLMHAIKYGDSATAAFLLRNNAHLNLTEQTSPIIIHAMSGLEAGVLKLLLDEKYDEFYEPSLLHFACISGNKRVVSAILKERPDLLNSVTKWGYTPIHYILTLPTTIFSKQHQEIFLFLLTQGASLDIACKDQGYYPIHTACRLGNVFAVQIMIDVDFTTVFKETNENYISALLVAVMFNQNNVIKQLLECIEKIGSDNNWNTERMHENLLIGGLNRTFYSKDTKYLEFLIEYFVVQKKWEIPLRYKKQILHIFMRRLPRDHQHTHDIISLLNPELFIPHLEAGEEKPVTGYRYCKENVSQEVYSQTTTTATTTTSASSPEQDTKIATNRSSFWKESSALSWCNGRLTVDMVEPIRGGKNCALYLDVTALREQNCPEEIIEHFSKRDAKFDGDHLTPIKERFFLNVIFPENKEIQTVTITHEMKLPGNKDRIYVFALNADLPNTATVFWACYYDSSGLHCHGDTKELRCSTKPIQLYIRDDALNNADNQQGNSTETASKKTSC